MKNLHVIKIAGVLSMIFFLFTPIAGCGDMTIDGVDLFKMKDIDDTVKLFSGIAMLFTFFVIILPDKTLTFLSSLGGLVSLIIAFLIIKGKFRSGSGGDFGMSEAIELKSGSYLSAISLMVSAVVSKVKNELSLPASMSASTSPSQVVNPARYCSSCGHKIEVSDAAYCSECGEKI